MLLINVNGVEYITIQDAAELCDMNYNAFYQHIEGFKQMKLSGKKFIVKTDVDRFKNMLDYKLELKARIS